MSFRPGCHGARRVFLLAAAAAALLLSFPAPGNAERALCASCHEQGAKLEKSAHASVACQTCHPKHDDYPHPEGLAKPVCGQCHQSQSADHANSVHGRALKKGNAAAPDCALCHGSAHEMAEARSASFRSAEPDLCGMCHDKIAAEYQTSVHGKAWKKGVVQAPVCTDCHGEHSIQVPSNSASLVNASHLRETCGRCHGDVQLGRKFGIPSDRVVSFDASFHGLAAKSGSQTVANCASCHGVHNILPSSDALATTNARNLPHTCGRCHAGAGTRFALGPIHLWAGRSEPASVRIVRQSYLLLIPAVIGLMFLHNFGDWIRKLNSLRINPARHADWPHPVVQPPRMLRFERILHLLLLTSFILLAWTGFQLKHPDEWWSKPLLSFEQKWSIRGLVHRSAAVVFILVAVLHLLSLIRDRKLRLHWKNLWPRYTDLVEAWRSFAYNVGLIRSKPAISPYSFIEKAEYWAVVWGGVIMTCTGVLLWANNAALHWLPKEVIDVATALHYYEAVLACLAILVWHFYMVIFDPEVYPLDTAWLTGKSVRQHAHTSEAVAEAEAKPELERASR